MHAAVAGRGVVAPLITQLPALLRGCTAAAHLRQVHALLLAGGLSRDLFCVSHFVLRCTQILPNNGYPLLVLRRLEVPNSSRVWSATMRECSRSSRHDDTIALFIEMLRYGALPDRHAYPLLLKAVANSKREGPAPAQVHAQVVKFGFASDPFVQNALVSCYATAGCLVCASKLFDGMCAKDSVTWTSMIHGYVKSNLAAEGLCLFSEMRLAGTMVDEVTIVTVLSGCAILGSIWLGRSIHGFYVERGGVKRDIYVDGALLSMYARCGCMVDAQKLFDKIPCRNVVSWTALITGYVRGDSFNLALGVFSDMIVEGFLPNEATVASVLTACAQLGSLEHGRRAHGYIKRHNLAFNSIVVTALIDMYAKCGCIDLARAVFQRLAEKDVRPWTAMINGLAMHGNAAECLDLLPRMLEQGVQPNEVTFLGILSACSHGGLLAHGRRYFTDMSLLYGIKPKLAHYGCMVDLLGRAGHLDEALLLIKNMPMDPSPGVWGALFGACMIHKNFELGESVGEHLIRLQPHHSGRYALLANMYSEARKWEEAASVRIMMKRKEVEKKPGCSWLEVNGVLHEFVSVDWSHSQSKDMHQMLGAMGLQCELEAGHGFDMDTG
ncbi:hypothetical protein Taro_030250 [Colocasia esculenta]|uniref:Pentatricopeptide repeat-containing protein n=1 Tax=Colocasia esculenta TaxID=4460 RepID=A0A843VZR0_COLES|nr:hypothetical protein [Colocasia esculenta]